MTSKNDKIESRILLTAQERQDIVNQIFFKENADKYLGDLILKIQKEYKNNSLLEVLLALHYNTSVHSKLLDLITMILKPTEQELANASQNIINLGKQLIAEDGGTH